LKSEALFRNLTEEEWKNYEDVYGSQNRDDETAKVLAYAYNEYADKIDTLRATEAAADIQTDLQAMGYTWDPADMDRITAMTKGMSEEEIDKFIQTVAFGPDGQLSPDGITSIYFFDWKGNPITTAEEWKAYQNDPLAQGLNKLWLEYTKLVPNAQLMTRDDFLKLATNSAKYIQNKPGTTNTGISGITTTDKASQFVKDVLFKYTKPAAKPKKPTGVMNVKAWLDYKNELAAWNEQMKEIDTIPVDQLVDLSTDINWWNANSQTLSPPGYERNGDNWTGRDQLKNAYAEKGYVPGALFSKKGTKYKLEKLEGEVKTDGDDEFKIYAWVIDLTDGQRKRILLGNHDTW